MDPEILHIFIPFQSFHPELYFCFSNIDLFDILIILIISIISVKNHIISTDDNTYTKQWYCR